MANWTFTNSTNKTAERFFGKEVSIYTHHRKDGNTVMDVTEPGNKDNWYFFTSTLVSIERQHNFEKGYATLTAKTHNSVYYFYKKIGDDD